MSARVSVYDIGMLIALADRKAKAVALHEGLRTVPHGRWCSARSSPRGGVPSRHWCTPCPGC
ncbi:hypothetical protein WJ438_28625 [Streptomyces sp. GD-15H]|uniref:hypothetical protein n=1 Tax=Streptomyces sp. GD-15H TaxID=3129112 RepID=UPI00325662C1